MPVYWIYLDTRISSFYIHAHTQKLLSQSIKTVGCGMKHVIFTLMFLCIAAFSYARTSPEAYLAQVPAAPKNCCGITDAEKSSFNKSVHDLDKKMEKEIRERKKEAKAYMDANRDALASRMITLPEGMETKGRKGKMTREEKKAMAEQMMREYGLSHDDPKKLKTMSKEERIAWGKTHGANADRKLQSDQKYQDAKKQAKPDYDLLVEQQALMKKIEDRMSGFANKFDTLDQKAEALEKKELGPIRKKLASYGEIISKEQEAPLKQDLMELQAAQKRCCETLSPQYRVLLDEYLSAVKASLPDYKRLETIIAKTQLGLDRPIEAEDGHMGIVALRGYLSRLEKACKYDRQEQ